LIERGIDLIGFPRLVRLNPNIPWKTRGNGAIAIHVGIGRGEKRKVGKRKDKDFYSFISMERDVNKNTLFEIVDNIIKDNAVFSDEKTNPGFVICKEKPPEEIYLQGVREILDLKEIKRVLDSIGAVYKGYKNERGLIGATAAISWNPNDKTYELITYRHREKWGTNRHVNETSVKEMDKTFPSTFDNYDYRNMHNRIAPNSSCPVLYGIRGDDAEELIKAKDIIESERYSGWLLFETNQGTDDHLQRRKIAEINPFESVIAEGKVVNKPITIKGGHVIFKIKDESGSIDCAAYEPTKEFREVIKQLEIGDFVEVYGGVRKEPFTINLEKIQVKELVKGIKKVENPICPNCGKHMKSIGKGQGYRCIKCGLKKDESFAKYEEIKRSIKTTFYEVPVCARRHLSKPLKRINHNHF